MDVEACRNVLVSGGRRGIGNWRLIQGQVLPRNGAIPKLRKPYGIEWRMQGGS